MKEYKKDIYLEDEVNIELIEEKLLKIKKYPLMLFRINLPCINRISVLQALQEFEELFKEVEEVAPEPYTKDFQNIDAWFLSTDYEFGRLEIKFPTMLGIIEDHKDELSIFNGNSNIPSHLHMMSDDLSPCIKVLAKLFMQNKDEEEEITEQDWIVGKSIRPRKYTLFDRRKIFHITLNLLVDVLSNVSTIQWDASPYYFYSRTNSPTEDFYHEALLKNWIIKIQNLILDASKVKIESYKIALENSSVLSNPEKLERITDLVIEDNPEFIENLQFLNCKTINIHKHSRIKKDSNNRDFEILLNLNQNVKFYIKNNIEEGLKTYEIEFRLAKFILKSFKTDSEYECLTRSLKLKLALDSKSYLNQDDKYYYITDFYNIHIENFQKRLNEKPRELSTLFKDFNADFVQKYGDFVIIVPKIYLYSYKSDFECTLLAENQPDYSLQIELCNQAAYPKVEVELYDHTCQKLHEIIEFYPERTLYHLKCSTREQEEYLEKYIQKFQIFRHCNVNIITDHCQGMAFECQQAELVIIKDLINAQWKTTLTQIETSLKS